MNIDERQAQSWCSPPSLAVNFAIHQQSAGSHRHPQAGIRTVRLHHLANRCSDEAIRKLCDELNATETQFPRTNLRLVLKLGST